MTHALEVSTFLIDTFLPMDRQFLDCRPELMAWNATDHVADFITEIIQVSEVPPPKLALDSWEKKVITRHKIGGVGRLLQKGDACLVQVGACVQSLVRRCIVVVENYAMTATTSKVRASFWIFSLNLPMILVYVKRLMVRLQNSKWTTPVSSKNAQSITFFTDRDLKA